MKIYLDIQSMIRMPAVGRRRSFLHPVHIGILLAVFFSALCFCAQAEVLLIKTQQNVFRTVRPSQDKSTWTEKMEATYEAEVTLDTSSGRWLIKGGQPLSKTARLHDRFVVEEPAQDTPDPDVWFILSDLTDGAPNDLDQDQRMIWLVYCARDYLRGHNEKPVPLPVGDFRHDQVVHACRASIVWRSERDLSPAAVTYYFDKSLFKSGAKSLIIDNDPKYLAERPRTEDLYVANHKDRQVMATLKVGDWIDSAGAGLPQSWQFDFYMFGQHEMRVEGTVLGIKPASEMPPFSIPTSARITDKRVRDIQKRVNNISYTTTNGVLPVESSQAKQLIAKQAIPIAAAEDEPSRKGTAIVRIVLVGGVVLSFGCLFYVTRKNKVRTSLRDR